MVGLRSGGRPCCASCGVGIRKSLDEEFGAGTQANTRCLKHRTKVKVVIQLNNLYQNGPNGQPYFLKQIKRAILDYEVTHGMCRGVDYEITAIAFGEGAPLALDNNATERQSLENPFQPMVEELMDMGVEFCFCQNTGRRLKVPHKHVLPGFKYVTAGLTAMVDFQTDGYVPLTW